MTKTATVRAQQKWEYAQQTARTEDYLLEELNQYGQDGWELVTVLTGKDRKGEEMWTGILKRPYVGHGASPTQQHAAAEKSAAEHVYTGTGEEEADEDDFQFRDEADEYHPPDEEEGK